MNITHPLAIHFKDKDMTLTNWVGGKTDEVSGEA